MLKFLKSTEFSISATWFSPDWADMKDWLFAFGSIRWFKIATILGAGSRFRALHHYPTEWRVMDDIKLKKVQAEALRFLNYVDELQKARVKDAARVAQEKRTGKAHIYRESFPKLTGATRRASMDLTRSLAELRRA